jgi:hypothetical protein
MEPLMTTTAGEFEFTALPDLVSKTFLIKIDHANSRQPYNKIRSRITYAVQKANSPVGRVLSGRVGQGLYRP